MTFLALLFQFIWNIIVHVIFNPWLVWVWAVWIIVYIIFRKNKNGESK